MAAAKPLGTRRINHGGYVQIKVFGGARRWNFEHRVVWEAVHGPIPSGCFIHHLNENKADNRLDNLVLCSSNGDHHRRFHLDKLRANGARAGHAGKGIPKTPEHRAAIAAAHRGKKKSPEHRLHIAAAIRGKKNPARAAAWQAWRERRAAED